MKRFLSNIVVKSLILTVLPLIYPSLFFYAIGLNKSDPWKSDFVVLSLALAVLHIGATIVYAVVEQRQKETLRTLENSTQKAPKEVTISAPLLQKYSKIIKDNADKLYERIKEKKGHSDIKDWLWMQAKGDELCSELHRFVKGIAENGDSFSVSLMFKKVQDNREGYTMLSRGSDDAAHTPASYRNFVPEKEAEGSFYKEIFDKNPTRPRILMNRNEIEKKFKGVNDIVYSQFVALPIACQGKTVGILQIVAYDGSVIATQKAEIERLCNNYFSVAANMMLLTDKNENVMQIL